jgi:hypothetical protein
VFAGGRWHLFVDAADASFAKQQLDRYERENPPRPVPAAPPEMQPYAGIGSLAYALVMVLVGYLAGVGAFDGDWLEAGALRASEVLRGELWRPITALTLHLDVAHLVANLGFGMLFGYFAGQLLGPGVASSIIGAAAAANLITSLVQAPSHSRSAPRPPFSLTLGAGRNGADGGSATRRRTLAYRYAPIVAGVALLAFRESVTSAPTCLRTGGIRHRRNRRLGTRARVRRPAARRAWTAAARRPDGCSGGDRVVDCSDQLRGSLSGRRS